MDTGISFMSYIGATPFYLAARSGGESARRRENASPTM